MPATAACSRRHDSWSPVINLGLPRTGTTSFAAASRALGMRAAHSCGYENGYTPVKGLGACLYEGSIAGKCNGSSIHSYDSLSDMPWFFLDRERLARAYPRARFVCTTRRRDGWVNSMVHFQTRTSFPAGGEVFLWHVRRQMGSPAAVAGPGTRGRKTILIPETMAAFYERHMNTTCSDGAVQRISLDDPAHSRWLALCAAAPSKWAAACDHVTQPSMAIPWPTQNAGVGLRKYDFNEKHAAYMKTHRRHNDSRQETRHTAHKRA